MYLKQYLFTLTFAVALFMVGFGCSSGNRVELPEIESLVNQRRAEMLEKFYEKREVEEMADVAFLLRGKALEAFITERRAFEEWYAYQDAISERVIMDIWQAYSGGSAGGSFQVAHLFDIAIANAAEQEILYKVLAREGLARPSQESACMEQIEAAKDDLVEDLKSLYSGFDTNNNWRMIEYTPDQLEVFLDRDLALFRKWMTSRKQLEASLESDVQTLYSSITSFWIYLCLTQYQTRFIEE